MKKNEEIYVHPQRTYFSGIKEIYIHGRRYFVCDLGQRRLYAYSSAKLKQKIIQYVLLRLIHHKAMKTVFISIIFIAIFRLVQQKAGE